MRVGVQVNRFTGVTPGAHGARLRDAARAAEAAGAADVWLMDHLFQMGGAFGDPSEPMLEAYTALGYLAGVTDRVGLGALVTAATYRRPGLLVKTVTTLDVLSGGRAWLGVGAGWYEREARGLGLDLPPLAQRYAALSDVLRLAERMWSGDRSRFEGATVTAEEPLCEPRSPGRPRVLVGGEGERRTLPLVAAHADAANLFAGIGAEAWPGEEGRLRRKVARLQELLAEQGRERSAVTVSLLVGCGEQDLAALPAQVERWRALGADHVIVFPSDGDYAPAVVERLVGAARAS